MLSELQVAGLGVIEHAELTLGRGSCALTGETGAGKTLLVAAVGLLLGGRADRSLVRPGADAAEVAGHFVLSSDHPAIAVLREHGYATATTGDHDVVIARSVGSDGRSKVRVNGRLATAGILQEVAPHLVVIAGQHEHHRLDAPSFQRAMVDAAAGTGAQELARRVAEHVHEERASRRELDAVTGAERARERELDVLSYEIAEIEKADLQIGESERLLAEAARLEHADAIATAIDSAAGLLRGDGGADELVNRAATRIRGVGDKHAELETMAGRLDGVLNELDDIAAGIGALMVEADPEALEATRAQLAQIARVKKKYGDSESDVLDYLERSRARRAELQEAETSIAELEASIEAARDAAQRAARKLTTARNKAARRLESEMATLAAELGLGSLHLDVELEPRELYEGGLEEIRFLIAPNPGSPSQPLSKIASGGELSRIALALHLLTSSGDATTMIFDEVDAGVGGEAAQAVGRCLGQLGRRGVQVLVVTHLPQVAAFADAHYRVTKTSDDASTTASLEPVEGDARVVELSRMLAGFPESARAQEHARELLDLAEEEVAS